jgi:SAM-dependent methyltransferase
MGLPDRIARLFADRPPSINLPAGLVREAVERHGAHPWFIYAFEGFGDRWHVWGGSRWLARHLPARARILETGCGCALNLIWLGQHGFHDLHGTDIEPRAIAVGRDLCAAAGIPATLRVDDGLKPTRLDEQYYDAILALNWTYHVEGFDLASFLKTYKRALKPRGNFVIDIIDQSYNDIPNNRYLTSDWAKPEDQRRPTEYKVRYSAAEVEKAVDAAGLCLVQLMSRPQAVVAPRKIAIIRTG